MKGFRLGEGKLRELLRRAVEVYNRYRAPEAVAEVVEVKGNRVYVRFRGSFCETCGVYDWLEDFKYVLEDLGVEADLERVIEPSEPSEDWRIGVFRLKSQPLVARSSS